MAEEELVEAMARALAPLAWASPETNDTLAQVNRRKASLKHARAALTAAREAGWRLVRDEDRLQSRERMLTDLGVIRK